MPSPLVVFEKDTLYLVAIPLEIGEEIVANGEEKKPARDDLEEL